MKVSKYFYQNLTDIKFKSLFLLCILFLCQSLNAQLNQVDITIDGPTDCVRTSAPTDNSGTWVDYEVRMKFRNKIDICSCESVVFSVLSDDNVPMGDMRINSTQLLDVRSAIGGITPLNTTYLTPSEAPPINVSVKGYMILPQMNCPLLLDDDQFPWVLALSDYISLGRQQSIWYEIPSPSSELSTWVYKISVRWYNLPEIASYERKLKAAYKCKGGIKTKFGKLSYSVDAEKDIKVKVTPRKPNPISAVKTGCNSWTLTVTVPGLDRCNFPDHKIRIERFDPISNTWILAAHTSIGQAWTYTWNQSHGFSSIKFRAAMVPLFANANTGTSPYSDEIFLSPDGAIKILGASQITNGGSSWYNLDGGNGISNILWTIQGAGVNATITDPTSFAVQAQATLLPNNPPLNYGSFYLTVKGTLPCGTTYTDSKNVVVVRQGFDDNDLLERSSPEFSSDSELTTINYSEGHLNISTPEEGQKHLIIYQIDGRIVQERNFDDNNLRIEFMPNTLSSNLYLISVSSSSGVTTRKIMINN